MNPKELAESWIQEALKNGLLGSVYIDIDYLQAHNDCYGHVVGDETIEKISKAISNTLQNTRGNFVRIGGDEFIVILSDKDAEETFEIAENIRSAVKDLNIKLVDKDNWYPNQSKNMPDQVTVSIGAFISKSANNRNTGRVLEMSDISCLFAKFAGKDRVVRIDLR